VPEKLHPLNTSKKKNLPVTHLIIKLHFSKIQEFKTIFFSNLLKAAKEGFFSFSSHENYANEQNIFR
jgi:hypothetical protein